MTKGGRSLRPLFAVVFDNAQQLFERDDRAGVVLCTDPEGFRMIDDVPALIWRAQSDGSIRSANRCFYEYIGGSAEVPVRGTWLDLVHEADRARVEAALAPGGAGEIEARLRRSDAEYRWQLVRWRLESDRVRSGSSVFCAVDIDAARRVQDTLHRELEAKRHAEDAARTSEESLRLILDNIAGLVTTLDASGRLEQVNAAFLKYVGGTLASVQTNRLILHEEDRGQVFHEWQSCLADGEPLRTEARLRRADGVFRWFSITAVPFRGEDGRVLRWYGLLTDIDDRKAAEDALSKARARLARATQLAALSEMAAAIAHEINQPLAAMVANADACVRWIAGGPAQVARAAQSAEQVVRDGLVAGEVIQRLRALYARGPTQKVQIDINQLILEVVQLAHREASRRGATILTELASELPPVLGDRLQLQQVILNLLHNGLDAMDSIAGRARRLQLCSRLEGEGEGEGEIVVRVQDDGSGMQDPERAFEAFFTTKEHGLGMGLSICRSIADAHAGRLWIDKSDERGTILCLALPAQLGSRHLLQGEASITSAHAGPRHRSSYRASRAG